MSSNGLISGMRAARKLIGEINPDLLTWSQERWKGWRLRQKSTKERGRSRIVIVAAITCVDDLHLHIGLMQLLGVSDLPATIVLAVPTHESARLIRSQARRDGWEMLVHILVEAECEEKLRALPASQQLIVFPSPAVLSASAMAALREGPISSEGLPTKHYFMGAASSYPAWPRPSADALNETLSAALREMLSIDRDELGSDTEDRDIQFGPALEIEGDSDWDLDGQTLIIPRFGPSDELVISALSEDGAVAKIAHQNGNFCSDDRPLRIRVPAAMLTTTAQRVRVEVRPAKGEISNDEFSFRVPPSSLQSWMMSAFLNRGGAGNPVMRAFSKGVGCRIAYAEDEPEVLRDIPVVWGVLRGSDRILSAAKAQQLYFFYVDHAYFNRGHGKSYRITRNRYEAGPIRRCPGDRLEALEVEVAPWRKGGDEIIVCPPTDYFMQAHGCTDWLEVTLATLRALTDRPIIVRQKPNPGEESVPLPHALRTAHALITHSSNVAIEAACLGTPVFVAPTSAAASIGRTDLNEIENPTYPDRTPWLQHLAYNQFSYDEISDGTAWRLLLELEDRELA
jgi:hypothetical protein